MAKKILHVVHSLEVGGLERVVVHLANNIDRAKYEPFICCISKAGELATSLEDRENLFVIGNIGRINCRSIKSIHDIVRKRSIDIIHSHNFPGLLYGFLPSKINRVPLIHTLHGYVESEERRKFALVEKILSRSIERYVCVSSQLREVVRERFRIDEEKLSVVYNGIPLPESSAEPGERRSGEVIIGSVGRLTSIKNYELLINAFSRLIERHPGCRLELVGGGEQGDALVRMVRSLRIEDRVALHGYRTDVADFVRRFDIFVLPSFNEGHSISLLEALGLGKVCVVSAVGGNVEIIEDSVNGFLFESNNADALLDTLTRVIQNLHGRAMDEVRNRALETLKSRFSLDAMLRTYGELYDTLAAGTRA